jgi:hypothetical protein
LTASDAIRPQLRYVGAWLYPNPQVQALVRAIGTKLRDRSRSGKFRLLEMPERGREGDRIGASGSSAIAYH